MRPNTPLHPANRPNANSSANVTSLKSEQKAGRLYLGLNITNLKPDMPVDEAVARVNSDEPANIPLHLRTPKKAFNPYTFDKLYHDKVKHTYTRHIAYQPEKREDPQGFNIYRYDNSDALTIHCARIRANESGELYVTASPDEGLDKMVNAIKQKHPNTLYFLGYRYNGDRFSSLTPYFLRVSRNEKKEVIAADIAEYSATAPVKEWQSYDCIAVEKTPFSGKPLTSLRMKEGETTHETLINTHLPVPIESLEARRDQCIPAFFTTKEEYGGKNYEEYLQKLLPIPSLKYNKSLRQHFIDIGGGGVIAVSALGGIFYGFYRDPGELGSAARMTVQDIKKALTPNPVHTGSLIPTHIVTTFHPKLIDTYIEQAKLGVDIFSNYETFTKHVPANQQFMIRLELPPDGSSPEVLNAESYTAANKALADIMDLENPRPTSIKWGLITRGTPPKETAASFTVKRITGPISTPESPDDTPSPFENGFENAREYFYAAVGPKLDSCIANQVKPDDVEWDMQIRLGTPEHGTFAPSPVAFKEFREYLNTVERSSKNWKNRTTQNPPRAAGQTR